MHSNFAALARFMNEGFRQHGYPQTSASTTENAIKRAEFHNAY